MGRTVIYKQYDQNELNRQYNNRLHVPDFANYFEKWELKSRQVEAKYNPHIDIAYSDGSRERLDIYPSSVPGSKTLIFIHGGYWQRLDKSLFHFIASTFLEVPITVVFITYPFAPAASMDQLVVSCEKAISWVYANIERYNGNPAELYLVGHSAGGHLATMMMTVSWKERGLPAVPFQSVSTFSGLFNLVPVHLSEENKGLKMDREMAIRNSPARLEPVVNCPLLITVGASETDEFRDQSHELYKCWKGKLPVQLIEMPGLNHFSVVEVLTDHSSFIPQYLPGLLSGV